MQWSDGYSAFGDLVNHIALYAVIKRNGTVSSMPRLPGNQSIASTASLY